MSSEPLDMYGITQPESVSRREGMKALARIASRVAWARLALDPAKGELRPDTAKECLDEVAAKIKIVRGGLDRGRVAMSVDQLFEIWQANLNEDGYGDLEYDDLVRSMGIEILEKDTFGDYQGDYVYLAQRDGERGILIVGYGSCSGCDALAAAEPYEAEQPSDLADVVALRDQLAGEIVWAGEDGLVAAVEHAIAADKWWACDEEITEHVRALGRAAIEGRGEGT